MSKFLLNNLLKLNSLAREKQLVSAHILSLFNFPFLSFRPVPVDSEASLGLKETAGKPMSSLWQGGFTCVNAIYIYTPAVKFNTAGIYILQNS